MSHRRALIVLLATPLLLTTACSGGVQREQPNPKVAVSAVLPSITPTINPAPPSSASPTKAPSSAAATSAASSAVGSAPASSAATSGGSAAAPAAGGNEVQALIESKFAPDNLAVKVGTEVTWVNKGGYHTVVGGADAPDPASPIGNNALAAEGDTVKIKFDKPGTYFYFCLPHQSLGMKGQIVVS